MQLWEFHQLGTEARLMPDGMMRTLVTANTVDWNFLITDGNLTLQLDPTNSTVQGLGSELSASTTSFMFNYSSGVAVCCDFYGFTPNGGGISDWVADNSPNTFGLFQIFNLNQDGESRVSNIRTGNQVIATAASPV